MNTIFRKRKRCILLIASVLVVSFFSCKDELGDVGLNLHQDELLNTTFFDTATITAYTAKNDSLITSMYPFSNVSLNLLGDIKDPVFGRTKAGFYTQFCLSASNVDFKNNAYADSLVLYLAYGGHYGDTMQTLRIRVYELEERLEADKIYYGYDTVKRKTELLGEIQIQPKPNTQRDTFSSVGYISIPLSTSFARNIFLAKSNKPELANNTNFINYFRGLYIEAEAVSPNGCMLSINLLHARSSMILYYGNDEKTNQSFQFNIDKTCVRFSNINHFDYAGANADLRAQLGGNYASAKDVLYGQSAGGIKTVIQFPHLKEMFAGKDVIIHKAELVITRKDDVLPDYGAPPALSLNYDSKIGKELKLPKDPAYGESYFGGTYDETAKQYAFRITKYVQDIVNGEGDDYILNLVVPTAAIRLSQSQFYGTNPADKDKRIKLKINYTIID